MATDSPWRNRANEVRTVSSTEPRNAISESAWIAFEVSEPLKLEKIHRPPLQQRIRDDAVDEEDRCRGVGRVMDRLPPVAAERRARALQRCG